MPASDVVNAVNGAPPDVLHCKSAAGLAARAPSPDAVQVAAPLLILSVQPRFAFTVAVKADRSFWKPALYAVVSGAVSDVATALSDSLRTVPTVTDAVFVTLHGLPVQDCAR